MRVRMPNGILSAAQARLLGEITVEAGALGAADRRSDHAAGPARW
jgi:sulfite reductase beta subunit-like hemoprotein